MSRTCMTVNFLEVGHSIPRTEDSFCKGTEACEKAGRIFRTAEIFVELEQNFSLLTELKH